MRSSGMAYTHLRSITTPLLAPPELANEVKGDSPHLGTTAVIKQTEHVSACLGYEHSMQ